MGEFGAAGRVACKSFSKPLGKSFSKLGSTRGQPAAQGQFGLDRDTMILQTSAAFEETGNV